MTADIARSRGTMPRVRAYRRWLALAAAAGVGCRSVADPALPGGATRLVPPPVYARWWAMTEVCSGLRGDLAAVTWYVATGAPTISDGRHRDLAGYYSPAGHRVVLADTAGLDGAAIRHEMLHALLGPSVAGHPRAQFLGRCAGTVPCLETCLLDAGPPPPADPGTAAVGPEALRVAGVVEPAAPGRAVDGGWFTFTVLVTNPRATPVTVTLAPSGDAGPPVSYSWVAACLQGCALPGGSLLGAVFRDERAVDAASATRFAAGETKRLVIDFNVGRPADAFRALPPGVYAFTGSYNGRYPARATSAPDTAVIGP